MNNKEKYVWGKLDNYNIPGIYPWTLLKRDGNKYRRGLHYYTPTKTAPFRPIKGMRWRHENNKSVIKITEHGHIYYCQDCKYIRSLVTWLENTLWLAYVPLFDPETYIKIKETNV